MKPRKRSLLLAALAALLCALPFQGAVAWKITAGAVTQGTFFQGSGVSFQAPPSYTLYDIFRTDAADRITLHGLTDHNMFKAIITVVLRREPFDLDKEDVVADLDSISADLKGTGAICVADERLAVNGADAQRRIFFFHGTNARPVILFRYRFNVDGAGIVADYRADATSPFAPDDVAALPILVESLQVE